MKDDDGMAKFRMLLLSNSVAVEALANILINKNICSREELQDEAMKIKKRMGEKPDDKPAK